MNIHPDIHLHAGQALGHYQLIRPLARRPTIEIWQAQHINLHVQFALKILPLSGLQRAEYLYYETHLRREAQYLAEFHHPHIVGFRDYILWRNFLMLAMEYAPYGSVAGYHPAGRKLPLSLICHYVSQIGSALSALHTRGLLHRDVKPGNMLLLTPRHTLLADFGLAVCDPALGYRRRPYKEEGTPSYMAPEQHRGSPCPASDQYGLAISLYGWLVGHRPGMGELAHLMRRHELLVHKVRPELPVAADEVLMTALHPNPARRYPSVKAFARAFVEVARPVSSALVRKPPSYRRSCLPDTAELEAARPATLARVPVTGEYSSTIRQLAPSCVPRQG